MGGLPVDVTMTSSMRTGWAEGFLVVALLLGMLGGCSPEVRHSKSGRYALTLTLEEDAEGRWVRFEVRERGKVVFVSPTRWAARHRTDYAFDDADRIWLDSSDVGTSVWWPVADHRWEERNPDDWKTLPAPEPVKTEIDRDLSHLKTKPP